jgi:uncharacterized Zn-binding protein involved in type VI secretion
MASALGVARVGDKTIFWDHVIVQGSPNVFTNNLPTARLTDELDFGTIEEGAPTVFANNLPIARLFDATSDDIIGPDVSTNVFIGEGSSPGGHSISGSIS